MQKIQELKKAEKTLDKKENKKHFEKLDKPIPKPKIALEDSISEYKGLSRENYGSKVII